MLSQRTFLEDAPKTALQAIHKRLLNQNGLFSNSQILLDCLKAVSESSTQPWFENLDDWQQRAIQWIFTSGERGLTQAELMHGLPKIPHQNQLFPFLEEACLRLAIFRLPLKDSFCYRGFQELTTLALPPRPATESEEKRIAWLGQGHRLLWQLIRLMAAIMRHEIKLTSQGELHKKSRTVLEECMHTSFSSISDHSDGWMLLLQYLTDCGYLETQDNQIITLRSSCWELLNHPPMRILQGIFLWWTGQRLNNRLDLLTILLPPPGQIARLVDICPHFWPFFPAERPVNAKLSLNWSQMPRALRELWYMGLIDIDLNRGRHTILRSTLREESGFLSGYSPLDFEKIPQPVTTPNFESMIHVLSPPLKLFSAACLATPTNNEEYIRFHFSKERWLTALKYGFPEHTAQEFLNWIAPPETLKEAVLGWDAIHTGSWMRDVSLLRVKSPHRFQELSQFPDFIRHTEETIPHYGFILKAGHENTVRSILEQFGLQPALPQTHTSGEPLRSWNGLDLFSTALTVKYKPDYDIRQTATTPEVDAVVSQGKYSTRFQSLDQAELLKVLRYAMVMEIPVEIRHQQMKDGQKQIVTDQVEINNVIHRSDPFRILAHWPQGKKQEIELRRIREIRLTRL